MSVAHAPRGVHLVGSVPLPDAEHVFRTTGATLGRHLRRVPDGETGERTIWAAFQIPMLAQNPAFEARGMRVMRANLDGSQIETLVDTSQGDARPGRDAKKWCVGIAIDRERGHVYWTQKGPDNAGEGRILRTNLDIPKGQSPSTRTDIEVVFDGLPEPIDLDLDLANRVIYCTDRGEQNAEYRNRVWRNAGADEHPAQRLGPGTRTGSQRATIRCFLWFCAGHRS